VAGHTASVERHGKEEAHGYDRTVDGRRPDAGPALVQLEAPQILGRCGVGRATEEVSEGLDVADIIVACLRDEVAQSCLQSCVCAVG
jgi:hypothetical protein